jgi:hypothetical protein
VDGVFVANEDVLVGLRESGKAGGETLDDLLDPAPSILG